MDSVKKRLLLLVFSLAPLWMEASHIVGGEFELIWIEGTRYRLNLVLYFDYLNGQAGALDQSVMARIYRQYDNGMVRNVFMPLVSNTEVNYTQPDCSNGSLVTRRLLYSDSVLILDPAQFSHPAGYYVSWERCCRNYTISNIYSPVPNGSSWAGQTFYLEFPAIQTPDGQPFIDSTPRLFPPLNDYACPYRPYYTDFGGIDDDGDSLVYSLVTPLSTKTSEALPSTPSPRPYPSVIWRPPYSPTNIMGGSPDLRISQDGFLTVTPGGAQGLYVFAVKVEEFRNQVKIGETRRDFQMLVVDQCPVAVPPQIVGKKLADASYAYDETMNVFFNSAVTDANRCIQVRVSDNDSQDSLQNYLERVKIKAVAMNFKKDLSSIIPSLSYVTLNNGSTIEYTICFPKCPYLFGGIPEIGIVAMDDACSLPLSDTLKVAIDVEPPPNQTPHFTSASPVNVTMKEGNPDGDPQTWPFSVVDDDGDPLIISLLTNGFVLSTAGMTFQTLNQVAGAANGELHWDPYCDIYDFTHRTTFQVTVMAEDLDQCLAPGPAMAIYNLTLILPSNDDPIIDSDLTANPLERTLSVTRRLQQNLNFNVTGLDIADNDLLVLSTQVFSNEIGLPALTVAPSPVSAHGTVTTPASLSLVCETVDFSQRDSAEYLIRFLAVDNANKCRIYKADTLDIDLLILPPLNQPPSLSVFNDNPTATTFSDNTLTLTRGASINLTFIGTDTDMTPLQDGLRLQLADQAGNVLPPAAQYSFAAVEGTSPVQAAFTWTPDCSIFRTGEGSKEYQMSFELLDDHCQTGKKDSVTVRIVVNDIEGSYAAFQPPNFVSPNGDDKNDYYAMERLIPETGVLENIMPNDNCASRFEYVRIYNRWGKEVFRSSDRDFKWFPGDTPAGTYYYTIKFTSKEYKGALTVMY